MPLLVLVLLLSILLLDVVQLLVLDLVLVLGFLVGVGNASGKRLEDIGGVSYGG